MDQRTVVVLGASSKPDRMSFRAVHTLLQKGYEVIPVNPNEKKIGNSLCLPTLEAVGSQMAGPIDTITLYMNALRSTPLEPSIRALHPRRVIFNPGAENPALKKNLEKSGIECLEACTLVMLTINRF